MSYLVEFFRIVSDETRLRIIILLAQGDLYVCQICGVLNLSQPKVSKHLSKLRDVGYVSDERQERYILYTLNLNDGVPQQLIQSIIKNIDQYPILNKDRGNLANKETYLRQCKAGFPG